jgi:hypothetical protein
MTDRFPGFDFGPIDAPSMEEQYERWAAAQKERAAKMQKESIRDGWIMGEHPVRFLRGNDHG